MNVSEINDINQLKVMAYDAIHAREVAEHNLQLINARITDIEQAMAAALQEARTGNEQDSGEVSSEAA